MENALQFLTRAGFDSPGLLLEASRLGPYATVADVYALPDVLVYAAQSDELRSDLLQARSLASELCNFNLSFADGRTCLFRPHSPSPVGGAPGSSGRTFEESVRLTRLFTAPGAGLTCLEHVSAGRESSAFDVSNCFRWIFEEAASVALSVAYAPPWRHAFSFEDRCLASGCSHLIPAHSLDETSSDRCGRPSLPPGKRIRLAGRELGCRDPLPGGSPSQAARHPHDLALEASVRTQFRSIRKSWKTVRAGITSYATFMFTVFPQVAHFPVRLAALRLWSNHFENGDTFAQYVSHLRFAHRVLSLPDIESPSILSSIIRGLRKDQPRRPRPRLAGDTLDRVIGLAVEEGDLKAARAYAVAYSFLFRCRDELFGLQIDGRSSPQRYHSHIVFDDSAEPPSVIVHLASRKNAPQGAVISRPCVCRAGARSIRCGRCALRALARAHSASGRSSCRPMLESLKSKAALLDLRRRGESAGVTSCSWHAFRRGAASDIIRSGGTVGFLLHQGGWKSGVFLKYLLRQDIEDRRTLELTSRGLDSDSD